MPFHHAFHHRNGMMEAKSGMMEAAYEKPNKDRQKLPSIMPFHHGGGCVLAIPNTLRACALLLGRARGNQR